MCRSQNQVHEDDWFGAWEGWPELSGSWWLVLPHFFSWVLLCLLSSGIFVWVTHLWKKLLWTPEHRQRFLFSVSIWGDVLLLTFYFNIFRLFLFLYKLTFRLFLLIMIKEMEPIKRSPNLLSHFFCLTLCSTNQFMPLVHRFLILYYFVWLT